MGRMLVFADLHLREENAELVLRTVLPGLVQLAKNHGCPSISCLGDFWQVRHTIPVWLLNEVRDRLHQWSNGLEFYLLSGNHDQVDVAGRNALESLAGPHVHVYSDVETDEHGIWIPYRKEKAQQLAMIELMARSPNARGSTLFGHFGVIGATVGGLGEMMEGIPHEALLPFGQVLLGHYHRPQFVNVRFSSGSAAVATYVGSPYHVTAGECNEQKRVLILGTDGRVENYPIVIGPRYWSLAAATAEQLQETIQMFAVAKGDIVHLEVPEGAHLGDMATVLHAFGVEQHTVSHKVSVIPPRLQVQPSTAAGPTLEDYFRALLQLRSGGDASLDAGHLLEEFRSIQMEAAK